MTKVRFENFTAFKELEVEFSPGINALIGENGTGKTHLMKACYATYYQARSRRDILNKLVEVFLPSGRNRERLIQQGNETSTGVVEVSAGLWSAQARILRSGDIEIKVAPESPDTLGHCVYVPVKEMLANAPGFLSLYETREVHYEQVYRDILYYAHLPALRNPVNDAHRHMLESIEKVIGGKITVKGEEFFRSNEQGDLEFTLLAEGWRKLGLLWLLIQNGTLQNGSVLFWDEPEANLNPKMYGIVMKVLLELQRAGVQVFFATHDYVILKELDLQMTEEDEVAFHSLYRDEFGEIACHTVDRYLGIHPNAISDAFTELYDREIERSFGGRLR